jgi:hypothetical protein
MGTRSEVGFCVRPGIEVPRFEDIETDWEFDKIVRDERGTLYFINEIKWYLGDGGTPDKVMNFLETLQPDDYILLEMYPGDGCGHETQIYGDWWDNDFGLSYISRLCYDDETK